MNADRLISEIKTHPAYDRVGMILCHNGVVRETSRDGRKVTGLRVAVDRTRLAQVLATHRDREGIVDIQVEIAADTDLAVTGEADDVPLTGADGIREVAAEAAVA